MARLGDLCTPWVMTWLFKLSGIDLFFPEKSSSYFLIVSESAIVWQGVVGATSLLKLRQWLPYGIKIMSLLIHPKSFPKNNRTTYVNILQSEII
jgi:hypothetical protein